MKILFLKDILRGQVVENLDVSQTTNESISCTAKLIHFLPNFIEKQINAE